MSNGLPRFMHNGSEVIDRGHGNEHICPNYSTADRFADYLNKLYEEGVAAGRKDAIHECIVAWGKVAFSEVDSPVWPDNTSDDFVFANKEAEPIKDHSPYKGGPYQHLGIDGNFYRG